jgi:hypothetical protein
MDNKRTTKPRNLEKHLQRIIETYMIDFKDWAQEQMKIALTNNCNNKADEAYRF